MDNLSNDVNRFLVPSENGYYPEPMIRGAHDTDPGFDIEKILTIERQYLIEPDYMCTGLKPLQGTHDQIPLDHAGLISLGVFDAIRWISENKVVAFQRNAFQCLGVIHIGRRQGEIGIDGVARQDSQINHAREQVKNVSLVREQRLDTLQIGRRIFAIEVFFAPVVVT